MLASDESRRQLDEWRTWLADPNVEATPTPRARPVVAQRIEKAQEKVLTDGRAITPGHPR